MYVPCTLVREYNGECHRLVVPLRKSNVVWVIIVSFFFYHIVPNRNLQQSLAESAAHNRAAGTDGLQSACLSGGESRVNLDKIDGDQVARLVDALADVVALAESKATADGGAGAGSPGRVEGVNVEGQMDGGVGTNVGKGHLHDTANAVAVNIEHAEGLDAVFAEDLLLANVDVAETNVDELLDVELVLLLDPAEGVFGLALGKASQESNGHAVDVAAVAGLGGVDIGVGIDPDDGNLAAEALTGSLGGAGDGANGNGVVAAESEGEAAGDGLFVGLLGDGLVDSRDSAGVLHAAVVLIVGNSELLVVLHLGVAVQLVAKLRVDLAEEAGLDEGLGTVVDTGLGLIDE